MSIFFRRLPKFDYVKPEKVSDALEILRENKNGKFRVYAGGTDVIPKIKERVMPAPETLVDLKGISELNYISHDEANGVADRGACKHP